MNAALTSSHALTASSPPWFVAARTAKPRPGAIQTTAWFIVLLPVWVSTVPPPQSRSAKAQPKA
jgi:hypothetical protein